MATIRFVHTDYLRLGTPLSGIASPATWLQQLATGAVRHAVRNVIETAITQKVDFLLIAGSVCESQEDLDPAVRWLAEQFIPLRREGIQVVAVADDHRTNVALGEICDIVLARSECLEVSGSSNGGVQLSKRQHHSAHTAGLVISAGHLPATDGGRLVYQAVPGLQSTPDCSRVSHDGFLSLTAGAVQTVNSHETWNCGCVVVDADLATRELSSTAFVSNPVRYVSEKLDLSQATTADRLISEITHASKALQRSSGQTVLVDWLVDTRLTSDLKELLRLDEAQLLHRLRNHLEAGHQGVWPRKIVFSQTADLQLTSAGNAAVEEYFDVITSTASTDEINGPDTPSVILLRGVAEELIAGLQLLDRVA